MRSPLDSQFFPTRIERAGDKPGRRGHCCCGPSTHCLAEYVCDSFRASGDVRWKPVDHLVQDARGIQICFVEAERTFGQRAQTYSLLAYFTLGEAAWVANFRHWKQ